MPKLTTPLKLPCGAKLPNRICKAAMTEGLADAHHRATHRHEQLYRRWSEGGAGLLLSGNVQVDRRVLERPANVVIDPTAPLTTDAQARKRLKAWSQAGTVNGNHLWMQISHAGRQSPRYVGNTPLGPSEVQLDMLGSFGKPRELTEAEILDIIQRFADCAVVARETGFTGVQIHAAHGYLLSSFLSNVTNQRTGDPWGGALENRARMLLEVLRATRKAVGDDFPISIKLNSDDFRKDGFSNEECIQVVEWLNEESVDLLEISGGNYEQPVLLGRAGSAETEAPKRESTRKREAYFLDYAERIRKVAKMPMMVTGGFRSRAGMEEALTEKACDVIGIGRPLVTHPHIVAPLLKGTIDVLPTYEKELMVAKQGFFSPTSTNGAIRAINTFGAQGYYYLNLFRVADGLSPVLGAHPLPSLLKYFSTEYVAAFKMHRARRQEA